MNRGFAGAGRLRGVARACGALLASTLLAATLAGCGASPADGLPGTLERDRIELAATADEPIVEIAVREGQVVAAGALLLAQDPGSPPRSSTGRAASSSRCRRGVTSSTTVRSPPRSPRRRRA